MSDLIENSDDKIYSDHVLGMTLIPGENIPIWTKKKKKKVKSKLIMFSMQFP